MSEAWDAQPAFLTELSKVSEQAQCIFSAQEIEDAIAALAKHMSPLVSDKNPIFVSIINGALPFAMRLMQHFDFPLQVDTLHISRYIDGLHSGDIRLISEPSLDLTDRYVVLLDDILDQGTSLKFSYDVCEQAGAADIKTAVLLLKQVSNKQVFKSDFYAMECPDRYVFGYGMDYKHYFRNLDAIYALTT